MQHCKRLLTITRQDGHSLIVNGLSIVI